MEKYREWLSTIYGFIYDGSRFASYSHWFGFKMFPIDRVPSRSHIIPVRPEWRGLLKHFHDLRCFAAEQAISFQRIIQKLTSLIICIRYLFLSPDSRTPSRRIRSLKRFIRFVSIRALSTCLHSCNDQRKLNPYVDFSLS